MTSTPSQPTTRASRSFSRTSSRAVTAYLTELTGQAGWRRSGRLREDAEPPPRPRLTGARAGDAALEPAT
jgi:hypothetical protein